MDATGVEWESTLSTVPVFELKHDAKLSTAIESLLIVLNQATVAASREAVFRGHDQPVDECDRELANRLNAAINTLRARYYARPALIANGYRCLGEWSDEIRRARDSALEIANHVLFNASPQTWTTPGYHQPRGEVVLKALRDLPEALSYWPTKQVLVDAEELANKLEERGERTQGERHSPAAARWAIFRAIELEYLIPRCKSDPGVIVTDGDGRVLPKSEGRIGSEGWKVFPDAVALREPSFDVFEVIVEDTLFEWNRSDDFLEREYVRRELGPTQKQVSVQAGPSQSTGILDTKSDKTTGDLIEEMLKGQSLHIFRRLKEHLNRWVSFDDVAEWGECFRITPDDDSTVARALQRLQEKLNSLLATGHIATIKVAEKERRCMLTIGGIA